MPRALLEEVPGADEYITAVSGYVDCRGLPSHGMWTHGSAEATGHKIQLCSFQVTENICERSWCSGRSVCKCVFVHVCLCVCSRVFTCCC